MKETYKEFKAGDYTFSKVRPAIKCADGFTMSVQGSDTHYCTPRRNGSTFTEVEIGFPSEKVDEFMPYCEDEENPTGTVYAYVPVEIVDAVIKKHGGLA